MRGLQIELGPLPEGAEVLSPVLAVHRAEGTVTFYNASGPVFRSADDDREALLRVAVMFLEMGQVGVGAVAHAIGMHRETVREARKKMKPGGPAALEKKKPGPKGPWKLKGEVAAEAQRRLDAGENITAVAAAVGLSTFGIRSAIEKGRLTVPAAREEKEPPTLQGPSERARVDAAQPGGIAVKRSVERMAAAVGDLAEAAPAFEAQEAVRYAGLLLALPVLLDQGLVEGATSVYRGLRRGFYGLRSMLLTLGFMALLRVRTAEQLTEHAPGELGVLLGLDRAPEVKTVRRKLAEMGKRGLASELQAVLARQWATEAYMGVLYVDGHVRPYHGGKQRLQKTFVQQRRMCMPATTDTWLNDAAAQPLLHVTSAAHEGLVRTLDESILPAIRELVGQGQRVTVAFDRGAWSPESFRAWHAAGFDVLTYRKGGYAPWPTDSFRKTAGEHMGAKATYLLAEQSVELLKGFTVREIRRLCDDGHQTAVITTNKTLDSFGAAAAMFGRWGQENFFRYAKQEFALNHLVTYASEADDSSRTVPNPTRKALDKEAKKLRKQIANAEQAAGREAAKNDGDGVVSTDVLATLGTLKEQLAELDARRKSEPARVALSTLHDAPRMLERERKTLTDLIKMVAYRAESTLATLLRPFYARGDDEGHKFLKSLYETPADLLPDHAAGTLLVRFHGLANPRSNRALRELCNLLTSTDTLYPGTALRLRYEVLGGGEI